MSKQRGFGGEEELGLLQERAGKAVSQGMWPLLIC